MVISGALVGICCIGEGVWRKEVVSVLPLSARNDLCLTRLTWVIVIMILMMMMIITTINITSDTTSQKM